MSVPILTASPSSVRTVTRVDERWKTDLRKRIEHDLLHIVEDVRMVRDTILKSPTKSSREHAQREYKESMDNIRTLAQEKFTSLFRQEMSERKQALNVIDSDLLDVARQQQWFLDNIRQDEERTPFIFPGAVQNDEVVLSTCPQQLERGSDKRSEGGYGSAGAEDEPDESKEGAKVGEGEGDSNPQQSPSSVPTQPLRSNSPVSQKKSLSYQRHPSTSKPVNDNDGEDGVDARAYLAQQHGSQPYSPHQSPSPGSQPQRSDPLAPEPSGISNFVHANGSVYNTRSVLFPLSNSVSSTDSLSSSAGLNHTESQNPDQDRGSSIAHRDTERPLMQNRDLIVPNIALRERQNSSPASPHDRDGSSPSTCTTVLRPTITHDSFPSPDDTRQGISRERVNPDDPRGTSLGPLRSRSSFDDLNLRSCAPGKGDTTLPHVPSVTTDGLRVQLDDQQGSYRVGNGRRALSVQIVDSEQTTMSWETETQRKEENATCKEDEARRKGDEALLMEKAQRLEVVARQAEVSAKMYEAAAHKKEAEAKRKQAGTKKHEVEAEKHEAEAKRREAEVKERATETKKREAETKERMAEAQRKVEAARQTVLEARLKAEEAKRDKEQASNREEEDARSREVDTPSNARRKDHCPGPALEPPSWQTLGSSRDEVSEAEDTARLVATKADAANRSAEARLDRDALLEQERLQGKEEDRRREEQWHADERERMERERQNSVGVSWDLPVARSTTTFTGGRTAPNSSVGSTPPNRPSHIGNPATIEGIVHSALSDSELHRKIAEPGRQRDQSQPQWHLDAIPRQRPRQAQRLIESERQNSMGVPLDSRGLHPPASSAASSRSATPNSFSGSMQSTRPSHIGNLNTPSLSTSPSTTFSTTRKAPPADIGAQRREHFEQGEKRLEIERQAKVPFPRRSHSTSRKPQEIVDTTHAQRLPRLK
jgi:hypothetical protein